MQEEATESQKFSRLDTSFKKVWACKTAVLYNSGTGDDILSKGLGGRCPPSLALLRSSLCLKL